MCGIVGYVGRDRAGSVMLDGLKRLEYRGYDSAGMAIMNDEQLETTRRTGRVAELENAGLFPESSASVILAGQHTEMLLRPTHTHT